MGEAGREHSRKESQKQGIRKVPEGQIQMCMTTQVYSESAQRPRNKTIERSRVNKKIPSSSTQFSHYLVLAN